MTANATISSEVTDLRDVPLPDLDTMGIDEMLRRILPEAAGAPPVSAFQSAI